MNLRSQHRLAPATSLCLPSSHAPRCINIYTPGWQASLSSCFPVSGRACSLPQQLQQIWLPLVRRGQALGWGLPAPGVEGAVGGRNSDLKKSQGRGKDPSSLPRLPTWPPSKSHLIPALAGGVGPASQRTDPPGGVCPTLGWRIVPKQTGWWDGQNRSAVYL